VPASAARTLLPSPRRWAGVRTLSIAPSAVGAYRAGRRLRGPAVAADPASDCPDHGSCHLGVPPEHQVISCDHLTSPYPGRTRSPSRKNSPDLHFRFRPWLTDWRFRRRAPQLDREVGVGHPCSHPSDPLSLACLGRCPHLHHRTTQPLVSSVWKLVVIIPSTLPPQSSISC